ncbi:MAG: hypothetical protein ACRDH5_09330 [bacterium]
MHQARLIGTVAPTTGIAWFSELVTKVMATEAYAAARRVFWVVDNGSSHAGRASVARMTGMPQAPFATMTAVRRSRASSSQR